MKVTTEIKSHEQKRETFETVQDADFAVDLTDSKCTSDGLFCTSVGHAFVPFSLACKKKTAVSHSSTEAEVMCLNTVPRIEGLLALKLLDTVVDVSESPASRMSGDPSRQFKPNTLKARQESCDRARPNMIYASLLSASFFSFSSFKLQWQPRSYASSTCGMKTKNSEESWQSRAKLQGSATGRWLDLSRTSGGSGRKTSNTSEKRIDTGNVGAGDWLVHNLTKHGLWFGELPDSATSELYASTSESGPDD